MLAPDQTLLCPIRDKHSKESWQLFITIKIPGALSPVLKNFPPQFFPTRLMTFVGYPRIFNTVLYYIVLHYYIIVLYSILQLKGLIRNDINGPNASAKPCSKMTLCLLRVSPLLLFFAEGTFRLDVFQGDYTVFYKVNEIYPPPNPSTNVFARKVDRVNDNSLWLFEKHHHITRI